MGTNFYVRKLYKEHSSVDDCKIHIGKRCASGWWCWDCGVTLCKGGNSKIHSGGLYDAKDGWYHNKLL